MAQNNKNNSSKWANALEIGALGLLGLSLVSLLGIFISSKLNKSTRTNAAVVSSAEASSTTTASTANADVVAVNGSSLPIEVEESLVSPAKQVKKLTLAPSRTIILLGEIGDNALTAADRITDLSNESTEPIFLILSGPGGSVLTGSILIAAIQTSKAPVYTVCTVLCASMDSMIHQYGTKRYMTDRSIIMFHPASAGSQGDVDRMYSMTKFLKRYTNKLEMDIAKRQHLTFEQYKFKTGTEVWIDAEDAQQQHITDGLVSYSMSSLFALQQQNPQELGKKNNTNTRVVPVTNTPYDVKWICTSPLCESVKWTTLK